MNSSDPGNGLFDFAFDQTDIEGLCRPRFTETPEYENHNDAFGMSALFKEYAGLPWEYPLRLTMEHGLKFDDNATMLGMDTRFETILTPSPLRAQIVNRTSDKRAIPIGFFFLYAKALFSKFQLPPISEGDRLGTLVFPFKSTPNASVTFDHAAYAQIVLNLPERFQPAHVCVYWADILDGVHEIYRAAGLPVVTAGHRYDPLFPFRLVDLCRRFRYAASNEIGTNLFVSVDSGCRFFYLPGPDYQREIGPRKKVDDRAGETYERNRQEFRRLFSEPREEVGQEQREFVDRFLGTSSLVSPRRLRRILLAAHRRFENRPWWHRSRRVLAPPNARDFTWHAMAPNRGWYFPETQGEHRIRWMGQADEAWFDLTWKGRKAARLRCRVHCSVTPDLKLRVNDTPIGDLASIPDPDGGFWLEGDVPATALTTHPSGQRNTVRITIGVEGAYRPCEADPKNPESRRLGAAISHFSLENLD